MSDAPEIKSRLDIVDVVGDYVKLTKAGSNFKARCPFHSERTPSFIVSPVRQTYHCFGCDKGGDMFSFVQELEGLDFRGALELLARQAGVELTSFGGAKENKDEKERLYVVLEKACIWYQKNLTEREDALAYLYKRGLKPETLKTFRVGFAPDKWRGVEEYLKSAGFSGEELKKAGLVSETQKGSFDRFRSRIMFPIADNAGRVVGFSGRIFGAEKEDMAKYINSPETTLFNKSRILYGFDKAKEHIRKRKSAMLVEGQVDVLMSCQEGFPHTIALSGTALSAQHAKIISRLADELVLAFDADEAGLRAALRAARAALSRGLDVRAVDMPPERDPADMLLESADEWKNVVEGAEHIITSRLKALAEVHKSDKRAFRKKASEEVVPLTAVIESSVDRAHFTQEIAKALEVPEEAIREEVENARESGYNEYEDAPPAGSVSDSAVPEAERLGRKEYAFRFVAGILFWQEECEKPVVDVKEGWKRLGVLSGNDARKAAQEIPEREKQKHIFEAEAQFGETNKLRRVLDESLNDLERAIRQEEAANILERVREKEREGKSDEAVKLLETYQKLLKEIHK